MKKIPRVILLLESSRASGRSLLRGVADYARHHGPWALYWEPHGLQEVWPQLKRLDCQGIILRDVEKLQEILALGLPAVVVGHSKTEIPGMVNVITDSTVAGRLAADHLLQCGFRHFAYCGFSDKPWSMIRGAAFQRRVEEAGYSTAFYKEPGASAGSTWRRERAIMTRWLLSLPRPVGLMACNDDRGENVVEACKGAGLRVPDEVAVIGVDNDDLVCDLSDPPLSSVALNFERAGYESARQLDRLMAGRHVTGKITVEATHVVARQSTNILAMEDPHMVKALRFIRDHVHRPVRIDEVAMISGLSRRSLQDRFRSLLDRTVLEEISRSRIEQIRRLLVETGMSISEIASVMGFAEDTHVARFFARETGMTPVKYRQKFKRC